MGSLQRRAIFGGLIWAVATVLVGSFALATVFDSIANRKFDASLRDRHLQVLSALGNAQSVELIDQYLTDPAYSRPYSGRYWQIMGEDVVVASRSLFDHQFEQPDNITQAQHFWTDAGPNGQVRGIREVIILNDGSTWIVSVAESLSALIAERSAMRRSVGLSFGIVGLFMIIGAVVLSTAIMRPMRTLRDDVAHRWDSGKSLDPDRYPSEVAPLVSDINGLIKRNRDIVDRGRRQAADLAHALKTPIAALRNDLEALNGESDLAGPLGSLDRIDAQIGRSLARLRAENASRTINLRSNLAESLTRLERLFRSMPDYSAIHFNVVLANEISVPVDRQDLEEMIGNLLENAFNWCNGTVFIGAEQASEHATICVEDDGPGIDKRLRELALSPGSRLDTAMPGTGLGLAISQDLANAYGGTLELAKSEKLGGLRVVVRLPMSMAGTAVTPISIEAGKSD
jgi:signal transduction histidine kinase